MGWSVVAAQCFFDLGAEVARKQAAMAPLYPSHACMPKSLMPAAWRRHHGGDQS